MKLIKMLLQYIDRRINLKQVETAKKEANELHRLNGKRYFVIYWKGRYMVINNDDRKGINSKMPKYQRLSFAGLMKNSVYHTS